MEHKWAIFYHQGKIIFVRSWRREVVAVADTRLKDGTITVVKIVGSFTGNADDEPGFTVRVADFLIRSHALGLGEVAPIPLLLAINPKTAAMWCMSIYGSYAVFATPYEYCAQAIKDPLRTNSLFHIAVAKGDRETIAKFLDNGIPIDLLANDGFAPLHWALTRTELDVAEYLIERGSSVDVRSVEGATPLMNAVQNRFPDKVRFLLENGADANAVDNRGFSALHRAAEMGELEIARALLQRGAKRDLVAQGLTALDLAVKMKENKIVELLDKFPAQSK